jgi:hypothetical protein
MSEAKLQTVKLPFNDFVLAIYDVTNQTIYINEQTAEQED